MASRFLVRQLPNLDEAAAGTAIAPAGAIQVRE